MKLDIIKDWKLKFLKDRKIKIFKNRKRMIMSIVFLSVLVTAIIMYAAGNVVEVKTASPVRGNVKNIVEQTGDVETVKKQEIYALYGGRLERIPVEEGQDIKEGQTLLEFDLEDLKIRLEQAEALLMQARENAPLNAGIAAASAVLEQATINKEQAEEEIDRISALYEEGAVSERDYRQAVDAYALANAQLNSAIAGLEAARKGETSQQAAVTSARAEVLLIRRQMEEGLVTSEIDGTVLEKNFEEGMIVPPGSLVMKVGDLSSLQVKCMFLASEAVDIEEGDAVLIKGDILKDDVLNGKVKKVFPQAVKVISQLGVEQQRVPVEIEMLDTHKNLKPGYSVDVEVVTEEVEDALMVPEDAVFEINDEDYVFVLKSGKAVLRKIVKGVESKDEVQVIEGLEEDEKVIVDPPNDIDEGVKVKEK